MTALPEKETIVVVGLGYVGLPLACLAAEKGYHVIGYAKNPEKIAMINRRESPMEDAALSAWLTRVELTATTDPSVIRSARIVIVCVPTPVDHEYNPDLTPVKDAMRVVAEYTTPETLVILESTVNPGICEEVVMPIFTERGKEVGKDYLLAHCPERINPGDPKWNVRNIPRVVGGADAASLARARTFYESIIEADIHPMKSLKEAEAVKIVENSFRDINIAFVNELARSFDALGIDVLDVIEGAKTKPFSFLAHYPSAGIGGHCIPVDPYYLIAHAKQRANFSHDFLQLARNINNDMPVYAVQKLLRLLEQANLPKEEITIGILGIAYKANIDDDRESPYYDVRAALEKEGIRVIAFDPHLPAKSDAATLTELLEKADALFLVTDHREFLYLSPEECAQHEIRVVLDGKNVWDKDALQQAGILYGGIGR